MTPTRGIAAFAVSLLLAACAQPQAVSVAPEVRVPGSELGGGRALRISVADKRPSPMLSANQAYEPAELTVRGDLAAIVREALSTGLARQGFSLSETAGRELRVEILALEYGVMERSGLSRHVEAGSRLSAGCVTDAKLELQRMHRAELRKPVFLTAQDERTNSFYVSAAVSDALNALLADRELIACLAR
jgi:uncharacterized lipoprotein YajG